MIPTASNYPDSLDSDENLYVVHDGLRLRLAEDYNPGDTEITVEGDLLILSRMPPSGKITLTEQCSDVADRAISFHYTSVDIDNYRIEGLELLPGFRDVVKAKKITNVTMNVMAVDHNALKDALIAVQETVGVEGTTDISPLGDTMEGRTNFLRNIALKPKAWFQSNLRTGVAPLEVEFTEKVFRLGTDGTSENAIVTWDFGDQTMSVISTISVTDAVPSSAINVYVRDTDRGKVKKTYYTPGIYSVKLTAENDFGSDECLFEDMIVVRGKAPEEAIIRIIEDASTQEAYPGVPPNGPFTTKPRIRSPINTLIQLEIPSGENTSTAGLTYAGEWLDDASDIIDPIETYSWYISDDLSHADSAFTKASFGVGGVYDLKLRVDTHLGAYRITTYEDAFDIIENQNLWLFTFDDDEDVVAYEYGLISETFKLTGSTALTVTRDDSFLTGKPSEASQKSEFKRNVAFAPIGSTNSGSGGSALIFWASGRAPGDLIADEDINVVEYNGFSGTFITRPSITGRGWNWFNLNSDRNAYFFGGTLEDTPLPDTSPANTTLTTYNLVTFTISHVAFTASEFQNGAQELQQNAASYDDDGESIYGHYSVYRSAWQGNTGYCAKNDGVGPFFRIKSFYRTEGTTGNPFERLRKLRDVGGITKKEGQLVGLSDGMYFFNNSGSIASYNPDSGVWLTGGPGVNSILYRTLQDTDISGYDDSTNRLVAASDNDTRVYLSFDYSSKVFLKYNAVSTTFSAMGSRPDGEQWVVGIY